MLVRPVLLAATLLACLSHAPTAHAYCRTHTDDPRQSTCPELCENDGTPLAWGTSDIAYGFNQLGFPGLSDERLRKTIEASFQAWEGVQCDGRELGFHTSQIPGTTPLGLGPEESEPNENVIVLYDPVAWAAQDNSARAFAVTAVWFCPTGAKTCTVGEILGADISFNGGMGEYGDCAVDTCSSAGPTADLQNVATHEIGHFFGLSHSDVAGSTMYCDAQAADTDKRSLAPDDVAGICASYPHATAFPHDREGGSGGGCNVGDGCSTGGGSSPLTLLGVLAVVLSLVHRRRRSAP
ncbi:MAG: hypothetical protein RLZZ450_11 [Pseudomonadota bacterium]|jgi:MYXO-CTERM domain-containing protein